MTRFKTLVVICSVVLIAALAFAPAVKADEWNKKTTVTFSAPVEIPGVDAQILPAGTYVFKLMDSMSDRNIVQVFSADETHIFATILAISNYRLTATDKTVMTFKERAEGQPEAIRAWFYPGNNYGQEFVYSKKRAMELAKVTNEPILATTVELKPDTPVAELKEAPISAIKPTGEEVEAAEVVQRPPAEPAEPAETVATAKAETPSLPRTASSLPLLALLGMFSLALGLGLFIVRKRAV